MHTLRVGSLVSRLRPTAELRHHAASHALPVLMVGVATLVGALAAFVFQIISARALGPRDFGLLAAFLAILNIAAIASSALQNAVAVGTAEARLDDAGRRSRLPSEATLLGLGGALIVLVLTPVLVPALETTTAVVILAAAAIPLSFWLSEAVGVLQGAGKSVSAVWWTTISLLARVALMVVALALGLGIGGVLTSVLLATAAAVLGAGTRARRIPHPRTAVFSRFGAVVLVLSLVFAWLVNADVIVLRASATEVVAGNYASAAILVKASFMLPATLSVYLLPRFVRNRGNAELTRMGERLTLGVTAAAGVVLALVFWGFGDQIARLVYGAAYAQSGALLLPLAVAYLPWTVAQSVLIRLTAEASRPAVVVVVAAAVAQVVGFALTAPDVWGLMLVQGAIGVAVLGAFLVLQLRLRRQHSTTHERAAR